ncbi:MAG: phosphotransferase [Actinobacteria bacterium]|nr:phosphotransferase [Actinomycetota bacterium]
MKTRPEELEEGDLLQALAESWGLEVEVAEYAEVGFGSHHWFVTDTDGARRFVTVDDLDRTPWLGDTREAAFACLRRAFDTAVALRDDGLTFVVAPISTSCGETVRRIGSRHTVSVFPVIDGHAGQFGRYDSAAERAGVLAMLARLHRATAAAGGVARRAEIGVQGRRRLESALRDVHTAWPGGPLSDPARRVLAAHASDVAALLAAGVRLGAEVAAGSTNWVVTHGEPHPGNVMRSGENLLLVDWDTVALAPPERDLWLVVGDGGDEVDAYTAATGHSEDANAIAFFGLAWELADLAAFIDLLRSSPRQTEDTEIAYDALTHCATIRERWGSLLG